MNIGYEQIIKEMLRASEYNIEYFEYVDQEVNRAYRVKIRVFFKDVVLFEGLFFGHDSYETAYKAIYEYVFKLLFDKLKELYNEA